MEKKIFIDELSREIGIPPTTIKYRLKVIGSFRYDMGRRYCNEQEADKVKDFRETYRQGLKQGKK